MNGRSAWCAVFASLLAGCFLEELKVDCQDSYRDCHALNVARKRRDEAGGDCDVYQCRDDGRGCQLRERDYDRDGYWDPQSCRDRDPKRLDCNDDPDGGGEFRPDADELCDARDNNCNGWIDEGVLTGDKLEPLATAKIGNATRATYTAQSGVLSVALQDPQKNPRGATWHTQVGNRITDSSQLVPLGAECWGEGKCDLRELAVSADSNYVLALGVDVEGCIDGLLRVGGRRASDESRPLNWRGSTSLGPVGSLPNGIEMALSCGHMGRGARSPSLAQSPRIDDASALGLFRAGSIARPGAPAPLAAVALRVQSNGSIDLLGDRSVLLDDDATRGHDAASIAPWSGSKPGYFVAYDSEQGVELAFVSLAGLGDDAVSVQRTRIAPGRAVRAAAIAVAAGDAAEPTPRGLAVAWREGTAPASIQFRRLAYAAQNSSPFVTLDGPQELGSVQELSEGPVIAYVSSGFREDAQRAGGWLVVWVEGRGAGRRVVGVRVDEATGTADPEPLVLADLPAVTDLFAYAGHSDDGRATIRYAFLSEVPEQQLNIGSLSCAAPE